MSPGKTLDVPEAELRPLCNGFPEPEKQPILEDAELEKPDKAEQPTQETLLTEDTTLAEEAAGEEQPPDRPARSGGPTFIVIVNPKSGGNAAGEFLNLPEGGFAVDEPGGVKATVFSYAITDPSKTGFQHLAREVEAAAEGERAHCIVAGGDGTVMWTIEEMFKAGIPVERVSLGTVPFGTGNDFSNVTGWGTSGPHKGFLKEAQDFEGLRQYVRSWLRAETKSYDIWEVSVQTHKSGYFRFIQDGKKVCTDSHVQRHHIKELPEGGLEMSKYMCNYFSLGLDARVGVGFDKMRQKSQLMNKGVYTWEGVKKLLFKKKGVIANTVDSLRVLAGAAPLEKACEGHDTGVFPEGDAVFTTSNLESAQGARLLGNPVNLIFMNIPSISGGLNIWNWSTRSMGTNGSRELLGAPQDFADGKLECLSYQTGISFYMEQLRLPPISGRGNRVYSGGGPLRLKFKSPQDQEFIKGTSHCKGRTYMEVDGEFFIVHEPNTIVVRHHCVINVLTNMDPKAGCCAR